MVNTIINIYIHPTIDKIKKIDGITNFLVKIFFEQIYFCNL